jgi:hypothetical protein
MVVIGWPCKIILHCQCIQIKFGLNMLVDIKNNMLECNKN